MRWLLRSAFSRGLPFDAAIFLSLGVLQLTGFFVLVTVVGWTGERSVELLILLVALWLVRNENFRAPFAVLSTVYFMAVLAGSTVIAGTSSLPANYISVSGSETLWLFESILLTALGAKFASLLLPPVRTRWHLPNCRIEILLMLWFGFNAVAIGTEIQGNVALVLLHLYIAPLLGITLAMKLKALLGRVLVIFGTLLPSLVHGQRFLVGIVVSWLFFIVVIRLRGMPVRPVRFVLVFVASATFAVGLFFIVTVIKYPNLEGAALTRIGRDVVVRVGVIEAHATLAVKDSVDAGEVPSYPDYWLSLIPGIHKPLDSGHLVYKLARMPGTRAGDVPYLPPTVPAELYMFGGWPGLILGSGILGFMLVAFWRLALRQDEVFGLVGFTAPLVAWCGIGAASFYGRVNAVKEWAVCLLLIWLILAGLNRGVLLRRSTRRGRRDGAVPMNAGSRPGIGNASD